MFDRKKNNPLASKGFEKAGGDDDHNNAATTDYIKLFVFEVSPDAHN